jgi:hypothetical protein
LADSVDLVDRLAAERTVEPSDKRLKFSADEPDQVTAAIAAAEELPGRLAARHDDVEFRVAAGQVTGIPRRGHLCGD